jgi:hypothetical protein
LAPAAAPALYCAEEQAGAAAAEPPAKRRRVRAALALPDEQQQQEMEVDEEQEQEDEEEQEVEEEGLWVQCENVDCLKWRRLPAGQQLDHAQHWFCNMHPGEAARGRSAWLRHQPPACCTAPPAPPPLPPPTLGPAAAACADGLTCAEPEQQDYSATFASCPGYVAAGQALGDPDNAAHFANIIASHPLPQPQLYLRVRAPCRPGALCRPDLPRRPGCFAQRRHRRRHHQQQ